MAHLGFLLTRSISASAGSRSFRLLSRAALNKGHKVSVIFADDGIYQCVFNKRYKGDNDDMLSFLSDLKRRGAYLVADYASLNGRGLNLDNIPTDPEDNKVLIKIVTVEELVKIIGLVDQVICL
ncbi:DsrE family protein [bacterium]|nr:DsrE family protein [bacterium]